LKMLGFLHEAIKFSHCEELAAVCDEHTNGKRIAAMAVGGVAYT